MDDLREARRNLWAWRLDPRPAHWQHAMRHIRKLGGLVDVPPTKENAQILLEALSLVEEQPAA